MTETISDYTSPYGNTENIKDISMNELQSRLTEAQEAVMDFDEHLNPDDILQLKSRVKDLETERRSRINKVIDELHETGGAPEGAIIFPGF